MTLMDPTYGFDVSVEPDREWVVVRPEGELDLATFPKLEDIVDDLIARGFDAIRLDLSRLTFIDSTGLHFVVGLLREQEEGSLQVEVLPGPPHVQRAFEVAGLTAIVPFSDRSR